MSRFIDADKLLNKLPDDLPYKASVKRVLMQAPTADVVEVRHGHWLSSYEYALKIGATDERLIESAKNEKLWRFCCHCDQPAKWNYNYCHNCGAKMDGKRRDG